jgi:parallel beta-helix repeat protein
MNRTVAEMILALLFVSIFAAAFHIQTVRASPGTIYIRADGSIDPPTAPISTVDNVTYILTGNITSDADGIVVERSNTIIDGNGYVLQGNFSGYRSGNGLRLESISNVVIKNANIQGFYDGVALSSAPFANLCANNITGNTVGVDLEYSSNDDVLENNITSNIAYGVYTSPSSSSNSITGNNITNNRDYDLYLDGISSDNTIVRNDITSSKVGIYLEESSKNHVSRNNVAGNVNGIELSDSSNNNDISYNSIMNNSGDGIGFSFESSSNNVRDNIIVNNNGDGVHIASSDYNIICENSIKNNTVGIHAKAGVWYYGQPQSSSNNTVYHNNIMNNGIQALDEDSSVNVWDNGYPSGGNYWSDYNGTDSYRGPNQDNSGSDGIGDTIYVIDANNTDRYPLMSPLALYEPGLAVSVTTPAAISLGSSSLLSAMVTNEGSNDDANLEFWLLINGTTLNSTTVAILKAGDSHTLSCLWTPTTQGTYNVTAYATASRGGTSIENDEETAFVMIVQMGVKAGDWIKVDYTVTGAPSGTPLPKWLKVEFLSVAETTANVRVTMSMSNGTEQNTTVPVDVIAGGQAFGLSGFVIPANLTTGDSIYMSGYGNLAIAGETTRTYAGASRRVVYASFSQYGTQLTYYWDKQTGVMVEASTTSGTMTGTGKVTETNMWQAQPFELPIDPVVLCVLIVAAIAIVGSAAFLMMRRKKKPIEATASEKENMNRKLAATLMVIS